MKKESPWGYLAALFTVLVWSTTYISSKILIVDFSPMEIALVRFSIGLVFLAILSPPKFTPVVWRNELKIMGAGFLGIALYNYLENLATKHTYASNVSIIVTTIPFLTVLLAPLFFKEEKYKNRYLFSFVLSMSGFLLILIDSGSIEGISGFGDFIALMAAVVFALYTLLLRSIKGNLSALTLARKSIFYGWLSLIILCLLRGQIPSFTRIIAPEAIGHFLFLGLIASGLCFTTWGIAVRKIGAIKTSQFIYLMPFVTIILSSIILKEKITPFRVIGLLVLFSGVMLSQMDRLPTFLQKKPTGKNLDAEQEQEN